MYVTFGYSFLKTIIFSKQSEENYVFGWMMATNEAFFFEHSTIPKMMI